MFSIYVKSILLFRIREQPALVQALRSLPNYSELPTSIVDYLDYNSKSTTAPTLDSLRTLTTTTSNVTSQPTTTSPHSHIFSRMNSGSSVTTNSQPFNSIAKENSSQKGVCLVFKKEILHQFLLI